VLGGVDARFDQGGLDLVDRLRIELVTSRYLFDRSAAINSESSSIGMTISYSLRARSSRFFAAHSARVAEDRSGVDSIRTHLRRFRISSASGENPSGAMIQILKASNLHILAATSKRSHQNSAASREASSFESISAAIQTISRFASSSLASNPRRDRGTFGLCDLIERFIK
jgi:hypothetical protein